MTLIEVDVVALKAAQRSVALIKNMFATQSTIIGTGKGPLA